MEPKHRQRIDLYCHLIVRPVHIKALWPYLFINGIFNHDDCNVPNWSQNITNPETIKDIILTIKTRGPLAFDSLLLSLDASGHQQLANILEYAPLSLL